MDVTARITPAQYAGFWPRLAAILLDTLLLSIFGWVLGLFLFDVLAALGSYGPVLGFLISLVYFGTLNGRPGNGQTLGKRCMGLRVVGTDGQAPSLTASALRAAIYATPLLASGLAPALSELSWASAMAMGLLTSGPLLMSAYLFVFNRPSRRVLHDLFARTCVIRTDPDLGIAAMPPLGRGHRVALAALFLVMLALPLVIGRIATTPAFRDLFVVQQELLRLDGVQSAAVKSSMILTTKPATVAMVVDLRVLKAELHDSALARKAAQTVLEHFPAATAASAITVKLTWGYDLGFVNSLRSNSHSYAPADLAPKPETTVLPLQH